MHPGSSVTRRGVLRASALLAALPLLAACGGSGSASSGSTTVSGSASAATTGSAATSSAATSSAATTASASAATTSASAATAAATTSSLGSSQVSQIAGVTTGAGSAVSTSAAAASTSPAPTATFVPVTKALPNPSKSSAKVTGKWTVLQDQDFQPAMNAYVRKAIVDYAQFQGWPLDVSYVAGFSAGGDLFQKLGAAINAGTPPDLLGKDLSGYQMKFLGLIEQQDALQKEMLQKFGDIIPGMKIDTFIDNQWWGVGWFTRSGGYWGRKSWYDEASVDMVKGTSTLEGLPDTLLKISDPSKKRYGWGMTINTCGDGESLVQSTCMMFGSRLTDQTGQLVKLNSPETVNAVKWLTDIYTNPKWKNMLPPGVNSWTDPSNNEAWLAGQIGYTSNAGTLYAQAQQQGQSLGNDTFLLQQAAGPDGTRLQGAGGNRWWIFKGSKNIEASQDFIRYMMDPTAQEALFEYTPGYVLPAYANLWNNPFIQNQTVAQNFKPVAFSTPPYNGIAYPGPSTAASSAVNNANVYTKMTARVLQGMKAEDSVKQAAQEAIQIYQQYGMKGQ